MRRTVEATISSVRTRLSPTQHFLSGSHARPTFSAGLFCALQRAHIAKHGLLQKRKGLTKVDRTNTFSGQVFNPIRRTVFGR